MAYASLFARMAEMLSPSASLGRWLLLLLSFGAFPRFSIVRAELTVA